MFDEAYYQEILAKYPATLSKEQIYKLCHISKRVAKYYLDNGIIPCVNTGHATHKYSAKTTDVIAFLRSRSACPEAYKITLSSGKSYHCSSSPSIDYTPAVMRRYHQLLTDLLYLYPDLLTIQMITELTGYSAKTIHNWTSQGYLRWFRNAYTYYAPKEIVIQHMLSEEFRSITGKSKKHRLMIAKLIGMMKKENTDNE